MSKLYEFIKEKSKDIPLAIIRSSLIKHGYSIKDVDAATRQVLIEERLISSNKKKDDLFKAFSDVDATNSTNKHSNKIEKISPNSTYVPLESVIHSGNKVINPLESVSKLSSEFDEKKYAPSSDAPNYVPETKNKSALNETTDLLRSLFSLKKERSIESQIEKVNSEQKKEKISKSNRPSLFSQLNILNNANSKPGIQESLTQKVQQSSHLINSAPDRSSSKSNWRGFPNSVSANSVSANSASTLEKNVRITAVPDSQQPLSWGNYEKSDNNVSSSLILNKPVDNVKIKQENLKKSKLQSKSQDQKFNYDLPRWIKFRALKNSIKRNWSEIDQIKLIYFLMEVSAVGLIIFTLIEPSFKEKSTSLVLGVTVILLLAHNLRHLELKYGLDRNERNAFELSVTMGLVGWLLSVTLSPVYILLLLVPGVLIFAFFIKKMYHTSITIAFKISALSAVACFFSFYGISILVGFLISLRLLI